MHHSGLRQVSKTILTIAGILLLIIFGTRAASQATSVAAVGGQTKKASTPLFLHDDQTTFMVAYNVATIAHTLGIIETAAPASVSNAQPAPMDSDSRLTSVIGANVDKALHHVRHEVDEVAYDSTDSSTAYTRFIESNSQSAVASKHALDNAVVR